MGADPVVGQAVALLADLRIGTRAAPRERPGDVVEAPPELEAAVRPEMGFQQLARVRNSGAGAEQVEPAQPTAVDGRDQLVERQHLERGLDAQVIAKLALEGSGGGRRIGQIVAHFVAVRDGRGEPFGEPRVGQDVAPELLVRLRPFASRATERDRAGEEMRRHVGARREAPVDDRRPVDADRDGLADRSRCRTARTGC